MRPMLGLVVLGLLTVAARSSAADPPGKELTAEEERRLTEEARKLNDEVVSLYQRGQLPAALQKAQQALAMRQRLYPKEKYPDGHPHLAISLNDLGALLQGMGLL